MIGIDIIDVTRIKDKSVDLLAKKIMTKREFEQYQKSIEPKIFLAKIFAAKEAFSKAFGTGIKGQLTFKGIEINFTKNQKPIIISHPDYELSISHEKKYLVAMVVKNGK